MKDVVNQYNLADRVIFAGQQDDVVPWLQAMDIFVLPSYGNEGVPQTLIQAMLCELIVVSTPVGSIAELVRHGVTGFLTPPKDSDELSCLLNRLLLNTIEKNKLQLKAENLFYLIMDLRLC
ncbi:glycosyltransferase family 4 protein [Candidatus Thiothrix anitrata]|uniref:Glycosyltransferase family 4 protein n=1 Tax=Candidatus Thiothrix anitrata TaxID=2823902 RepID=A0ABX7X228_9GAMM|nr:glycosyltransferase family 4 protein [Candidatus Thiothrix anitrata]QTR48838.1 glycosyltransferase family 4 protein [Candidatus Thiothrix anitrata]